jgi:hypothetical protein
MLPERKSQCNKTAIIVIKVEKKKKKEQAQHQKTVIALSTAYSTVIRIICKYNNC